MSSDSRRSTSTARIYRDTGKRAKIVLAAADMKMADFLDEVLAPALDRLEREHLSRYGSKEPRTRRQAD